jgi:hypothetical protein
MKNESVEGAGRKSNEVNELRRCVAQGLLTEDEEHKQWLKYLNSDDPALALKAFTALEYLESFICLPIWEKVRPGDAARFLSRKTKPQNLLRGPS